MHSRKILSYLCHVSQIHHCAIKLDEGHEWNRSHGQLMAGNLVVCAFIFCANHFISEWIVQALSTHKIDKYNARFMISPLLLFVVECWFFYRHICLVSFRKHHALSSCHRTPTEKPTRIIIII